MVRLVCIVDSSGILSCLRTFLAFLSEIHGLMVWSDSKKIDSKSGVFCVCRLKSKNFPWFGSNVSHPNCFRFCRSGCST